jgi:hypothetical protein
MYKIIEAINYNKYKDLLDENLFSFFVNLDPTTDKKYAQWIIHNFFKMYKAGIDEGLKKAQLGNNPNDRDKGNKNLYKYPLSHLCLSNIIKYYSMGNQLHSNKSLDLFFQEDHKKITNDLKSYTLLKNKNILKPEEKNIMNIKGYDELWTLIESYEDKLEQIELENIDSNEYEKWYEDKEWLVVSPHTHKAACKYGANTRWCTASRDDASMFDYYTKDGPLVIIINKGVDKWQLHFESNQWKDVRDNEIGGREEFLIKLPENLKDAIYNKTNNILFLKDFHVYLNAIANDESKARDVLQYLEGSDLSNAWSNNDDTNDNRYAYPMTSNLLASGISDYISQNIDNFESYDQGYDSPWDYIDEEPLYKDRVEDCEHCEGSGFGLPNNFSNDTYETIEKENHEGVNKILTPLEQKQLLSLYKRYNDTSYVLIRNDKELATKLNQKCKSCKGSGKGNLKDVELYSEEQREEAGNKAQDDSLENEADDMVRSFTSYRSSSSTYGKETIDKIFDSCLEILSGNTGAYLNDFNEIVVTVLQINIEQYSSPDKGFERTLVKYVNEIRAKDVKN